MKVDRRLLRSTSYAKREFYLTVLTGFAGGLFIVLQARYISKIVNAAFLDSKTLQQLTTPFLLLIAIILMRAIMVWLSEGFASRMAAKVKYNLRRALYDKIARLGPIYTRKEKTGELINTVNQGIEELDAYFSQYIPQLTITAMIPLTILVFVFPVDWISGVIMILTAPIIPLLMILIGHLADRVTKKQWSVLSRMSAHFLDVLQGLTTLKIFGRSKEQIRTIAEYSEIFRQATMKVLRVAFISALALELIATLSTAIIAVEIGLRLLYSKMTFEYAFFILILAPEFYIPFRQLGARFHAGMNGVAAAERIFKILQEPELEVTNKKSIKPGDLHQDIIFDNVSFSYGRDSQNVLDSISFTLKKGEKTALVGPTGSGKTTITSLLLRFIEPQEGRILVGDTQLNQIDKEYWLKHVAWVPQNPYLFNASVLDNIKLANPQADIDEVIKATQLAHAHEFIQQLPQGYDTIIGERGTRLSGGQAQRIALARAFLKNAPFLILDEATSNLDPEIESLIQDATDKLMQGSTVLIIAHRLSTVKNADKIIVLDKGRIIEQGTHNQLITNNKLYSNLVKKFSGKG